jgi:hypothetical protein
MSFISKILVIFSIFRTVIRDIYPKYCSYLNFDTCSMYLSGNNIFILGVLFSRILVYLILAHEIWILCSLTIMFSVCDVICNSPSDSDSRVFICMY